jgi:hypothetical protein
MRCRVLSVDEDGIAGLLETNQNFGLGFEIKSLPL